MPRRVAVPRYCLHKSSGHARVKIHGSYVWLGKYGTPESRERYRRAIAETDRPAAKAIEAGDGLTVVELLATYYDYCQ